MSLHVILPFIIMRNRTCRTLYNLNVLHLYSTFSPVQHRGRGEKGRVRHLLWAKHDDDIVIAGTWPAFEERGQQRK